MRGDCISDNEGINLRDAEERQMKMTMGDPPNHALTTWTPPHHSTYLNGHQPHELARLAEPYPNQHTHELSIAETMAPGRVVNISKPKPPADERWYHGDEREYRAEYGNSGEAFLVLTSKAVLAKFDTFADAQLAAEALNNHKGY